MKTTLLILFFGCSLHIFGDVLINRDPFKPVPYTAASISVDGVASEKIDSVILTGIIWDEEMPYAVISAGGSRQIVKRGDTVGTATVEAIHLNDVLLKQGRKTLILEKGKVSKLK